MEIVLIKSFPVHKQHEIISKIKCSVLWRNPILAYTSKNSFFQETDLKIKVAEKLKIIKKEKDIKSNKN